MNVEQYNDNDNDTRRWRCYEAALLIFLRLYLPDIHDERAGSLPDMHDESRCYEADLLIFLRLYLPDIHYERAGSCSMHMHAAATRSLSLCRTH